MREGLALTKTAYVYDAVRSRILLGTLAPGEPIPQGQLAEELGVSLTPLREALRRLQSEGLVTIYAHRDVRPTALTAADAQHLFEVRLMLDPEAARLAAERRDDAEAEALAAALARLRPLSDPKDLEAIMLHREFHQTLYRASHNPTLIAVLDSLWDRADRYRGLTMGATTPAQRARVDREHAALARAVAERDADAARATMHDHVAGSLGRRAIGLLE